MDPIAMLIRLAFVLVLLGVGYAVLIVLTVRHLGANWIWAVWACTLAVLTAWGVWKTSLFPGGSTGLSIYLFVAFLGLPLAVSTWAMQRGYRQKPDRRAAARVSWGFGAFLVALPFGFVIAAIPDAMTLFK